MADGFAYFNKLYRREITKFHAIQLCLRKTTISTHRSSKLIMSSHGITPAVLTDFLAVIDYSICLYR